MDRIKLNLMECNCCDWKRMQGADGPEAQPEEKSSSGGRSGHSGSDQRRPH